MKTPHAILIGLAFIAAALFFREPSVAPAQAGIGGVDGFMCPERGICYILDGDSIYGVGVASGVADTFPTKYSWQ